MEYTRTMPGRTDYLGGIDNEGLDFGQLEQFIHVANDAEPTNAHDNTASNNCTQGRNANGINGQNTDLDDISVSSNATLASTSLNTSTTTQTHLPESPPDSGSEPPYSPTDLQGLGIVGTPNLTTSHQRNIHQQRSPGISSESLATIADFAQTSIDIQQNHISILATHNGHQQHEKLQQPQHHLQNGSASYLRMDHHSNDQHIHSQHSLVSIDEMTVCKQEGLLLQQPESQIMPPAQNDDQLMDTYRSALSQGSLLNIGSGQLSTDDLSRLMSTDVYSPTSPTITIRGCQLTPHTNRKRKISHTDVTNAPLVKPEPSPSLSPICQQNFDNSQSLTALHRSPEHGSNNMVDSNGQYCDSNGVANGGSPNGESCSLQCIRFSPFQQQNWHTLCNQSLQDLPLPYYNVDADKGFNFSNSDEAYVCQKKNHFQITCHAKLHGSAVFVRTLSGLEKIKSFHLHFYGVKLEAPNHTIRIEQSQSDRSKKPFHPVPIDLQSDIVSKITVVRLHFSETTSNNMRKKGRPNPEQRYFQLVVGLHAHTHSGHFPIISHGSERIIVRASNPGQFESDVELCWQRGVTPESIFHAGRVGINTDRPDESLVVHGNLKVSGHIVQPSDSRAKQEISELDTSEQLKNLQKIRIVKYRYEPEFAAHSGLRSGTDDVEIVDTGVIAQEVREVLPDAVQEAGNIVLSNGQVIEKFLLVNKDRILMENIGAVKELCKVTGSLETRIEQLEKINSRLIRIQQLERNNNCALPKCKHLIDDDYDLSDELCSNKTIQKIIVILVVIMAMCLLAISALYFVEHRQHYVSSNPFASREQIYKQLPASDKQQSQHQQLSQQQDALKVRYEMNYPIATGDIPGNDIDYPIGWKYQFQSSISSPNPRDVKNSGTTMLSLSNNQVSGGSDYDTDNLAIIPSPLGDDSSEKISENNMPMNSFESERNKKTVKGKIKSLTQTSPNPKKNQYQLHITSQQDEIVRNSRQKINTANQPNLENKSHADTAEDQDLQYLSNNNDSDDQFPMENIVPVSNFAVKNHSVNALRIGTPFLCESVETATIDCQSLCCEESNKLLETPEISSGNLNLNRTRGSNEKNTLLPNNSASSLCSTANKLQPSNNNKVDATLPISLSGRKQETFEVDSIIQDSSSLFSKQHAGVVDSSKHSDRQHISSSPGRSTEADNPMLVDAFFNGEGGNKSFGNNVSNDPNRITPDGGCYPVSFFIRSASFNTSGGKEEVCLSGKQVRHIIYTVAISKYMRETKIELHFVGPSSLQWSLCDQRENSFTGTIGSDSKLMKNSSESHGRGTNIDSNSGIFQLYQSRSVFHLHLPNYGFFEKQFVIRAGYDHKSVCQDQIEDSNKLLQYNFRIFRDCN